MSIQNTSINFYDLGKNVAIKSGQKAKADQEEQEKKMGLVALTNTKNAITQPLNKRIYGLINNIDALTKNNKELVDNLLKGQFYLANKITNQIITCNVMLMSQSEELSDIKLKGDKDSHFAIIQTMWRNAYSAQIRSLDSFIAQRKTQKDNFVRTQQRMVDESNALNYRHSILTTQLDQEKRALGYNLGIVFDSIHSVNMNLVSMKQQINTNFNRIKETIIRVENKVVGLTNKIAQKSIESAEKIRELLWWRTSIANPFINGFPLQVQKSFGFLGPAGVLAVTNIQTSTLLQTAIAYAPAAANAYEELFGNTAEFDIAQGLELKPVDFKQKESEKNNKPKEVPPRPALDHLANQWVTLKDADDCADCLKSEIGQILFLLSSEDAITVLLPPVYDGDSTEATLFNKLKYTVKSYEITKLKKALSGKLTKGVWVSSIKPDGSSDLDDFMQVNDLKEDGRKFTAIGKAEKLYESSQYMVMSYVEPYYFYSGSKPRAFNFTE